jgi:hypothetical protein
MLRCIVFFVFLREGDGKADKWLSGAEKLLDKARLAVVVYLLAKHSFVM